MEVNVDNAHNTETGNICHDAVSYAHALGIQRTQTSVNAQTPKNTTQPRTKPDRYTLFDNLGHSTSVQSGAGAVWQARDRFGWLSSTFNARRAVLASLKVTKAADDAP
jgi:hypothetical protein